MFTGIVETVGRVTVFQKRGDFHLLGVESDLPVEEISIGDSVDIDGCCQTVVRKEGRVLFFEVSPETLSRTTARDLRRGDRVNLERALRLGDRLGGHMVLGHVDGVGTILDASSKGDFKVCRLALPQGLGRYMVEKGSVAVDGISLTVNEAAGDEISVGLIPHTLDRTVLAAKGPGDRVNVEADMIGKYVERLLRPEGRKETGLDREFLARHGFLDEG
jgi:riboflavin synthase